LDKVFLSENHDFKPYTQASALQGEIFSLQLAYKGKFLLNPLKIEVISDEPYEKNKAAYAFASELFHRKFPQCRFIIKKETLLLMKMRSWLRSRQIMKKANLLGIPSARWLD